MMIWNQGELSSKLSVKDLKTKHPSYPRNKLLADVFYKAGYIETWGRGTLKVIEECERHNLPEPTIETGQGGFSITLYKGIYNEKYLSQFDLNERQIRAVEYLKKEKFITNSVYRKKFNVTDRT